MKTKQITTLKGGGKAGASRYFKDNLSIALDWQGRGFNSQLDGQKLYLPQQVTAGSFFPPSELST